MLSLVIGGARSGKSRFAQSLVPTFERVTYIATSRPEDAEMAERIRQHRLRRPGAWTTVEEPLEIGKAVEQHVGQSDAILLDCLTLWLSNFCWEHRDDTDANLQAAASVEVARVAAAAASGRVVVVTNEVGCGLVPETAVGRRFRDLQGWVNQDAARLADRVYHVVAGIPVAIKPWGGGL